MRTSVLIVRRVPRSAGGDAGISLIEVVLAMTLFAIVAAGVAGVLTSAIASHGLARERTLAQQSAQDQIEALRRVPYDQLGTTAGNPPGTVVPSRPIATVGLSAQLNTQIRFVDDPTPNSYSATAHYKRITVTVLRDRDSKRLVRAVTYVAPPTGAPFGGITNAVINVTVSDFALNTAVADVDVDLRTGPSAPRDDETDASGVVRFAGLTANPLTGPQAFYDLFVTEPGYETLREDVPPAAAAHVSLAPGETFDTVLRIYRPATINVVLQDLLGNPFTGAAMVSLGSSRGSEEFTVTGGTLTRTQLAGEPIVSGLQYSAGARVVLPGPLDLFAMAVTQTVPDAYPTDLDTTFTLRLLPLPTGRLNVQVRKAGNPLPGARVEVRGGPLPVYLTGFASTGGVIDFDVVPGPGYTITATGVNGEGTGSVTATAPVNGTNPVTVNIP